MKAYRLHAVNDLRYDTIDIPALPDKDWCIVKVHAAGICSSDIPRIFTKGTYYFPTIPGHEFSGEVYSVGKESDERLIGKHVGVFPLIPCRHCEQCEKGNYEMCAHYNYLGSRCDGGFAEYVAVPIWNLVELPESVTYEQSAMLEPLSVAFHAITQGNLTSGMNVAIVGTGMIGISAGLWAKKTDAADIHVIGRSEKKRNLVENTGLDYIDSSKEELGEYDFVLEAVGTPQSINQAINIVKPGSTVILMGNPSGDITLSQDIYWRILRKQLTVKGTWNSKYDGHNYSDWTIAVAAIANNEIDVTKLISHRFKQDNLKDGLSLMHEHREPYCKVMTFWNE
ncbi:MAG: galactitol-1-phosphate 5-dehydrogenase [Prevotella sp.]|jgi:L-iditol 2-dehydrogenase|nr:galactitol-1-phosphate 5-dehydrogenase [Prevotella sp.]